MVKMCSREKEGDLTQSYDKTPYTNRKFENLCQFVMNSLIRIKGKYQKSYLLTLIFSACNS